MRLLGGGAQSDLMAQTLANVLERPVLRMADPRWGGTLGAAICARVALGWAPDLAAASCTASVERRFIPDPSLFTLYRRRFEALKGAYANNKRWFCRMNGLNPPKG